MARVAALAVAAAATGGALAANPLSVAIAADGSYTVDVAGWTTLRSAGPAGVHVSGAWAALSPGAPVSSSGADAWGAFNETTLTWSSAGAPLLATAFRTYADVPALLFTQTALAEVATGGGSSGNISTSFPSFAMDGDGSVGFAQWQGPFIDGGVEGPTYGTWSPKGGITSGLRGGPIVLFGAQPGSHAAVLSPASQFMGTSFAQFGPSVHVGLLGSFETIPAGHATSTVLWYGAAGVNPAMMAWGAGLLALHGKAPDGVQTDVTAQSLTYNTDHGTYLYYNPKLPNGTTGSYTDALLAVKAYADSLSIPYKTVLLDSWWYFKGAGDGVTNWTAMPAVFPPGGNAGLTHLIQATGWKTIAHNRYWADDVAYAKQNGGNWDFFIDPPGQGNKMAVPLQAEFWEWLLSTSVANWGLNTYEQDWLFNLLEGVTLLTQNATAGRTWLLQMQAGASAAGVRIQFCMAYPRHALQSVEMPAVTQIRASDDHVPGAGYVPLQWRLGASSMLAWALALAPFKDGWYSTHVQPGGSVGNAIETSPALQAAVSVLSAGPVAPGDGVGYSDAALIGRTCTTGGKLLHPSRAATYVDGALIGHVFRGQTGTLPYGEVVSTYSLVSGWAWDSVLVAALNGSYALAPADLAATRADAHVKDTRLPASTRLGYVRPGSPEEAALRPRASASGAQVAYAVNATTFDASTLVVQPFSAGSPIGLVPCGEVDFALWHTAPVFDNGLALLGDLTKFVPMSPARVAQVGFDGASVSLALVGEPGEAVPITYAPAAGSGSMATSTATCVLGGSGKGTLTLPAGTCDTA